MTDGRRPGGRHGNGEGGETPDGEQIRRRFAVPDDGAPVVRHRRRREPGDPTTTGSIPVVRTDPQLPDPTVEYRRPEQLTYSPNPYLEIDYSQSTLGAPMEIRYAGQEPWSTQSPAPQPRAPQPPEPRRPEPRAGQPPRRAVPAPVPPRPATPPAPPAEPAFDILDAPETVADPVLQEPVLREPVVQAGAGGFSVLEPEEPQAQPVSPAAPEAAEYDAAEYEDALDTDDEQRLPPAHKHRKALIALIAVAAVVVLVGVLGLRALGVFDSRKDFDSTTGGENALVHIPASTSLRDFGQILTDAGVVGSQRAFVDAADGRALPAGYFQLPTGISAATAVSMLEGDGHRVGWLVIPEGLQLDSKEGADGQTTRGIFAMLAEATAVDAGGETYGVTVDELEQAAATESVSALGIPDWAQAPVAKLTGDHRRIEGLIAPGAWEDLDPRLSATELLKDLISRSNVRFEAWGLLSGNQSGLLPYDALIVASIVEREVRHEDDFPKVARVILNRLDRGQKLEMDSTANYTAAVTDIDVKGEAYSDENDWNTYQREGLPVTPIGAVGERALKATENPAEGRWLYFVTVDDEGTTLFANTYERHKQNREIACDNGLLVTGCS